MIYKFRDHFIVCGVLTLTFSSIISGGLGRAINYEIEVLALDVKWFMQYSGFGETTTLSLYTKTGPNSTWRNI